MPQSKRSLGLSLLQGARPSNNWCKVPIEIVMIQFQFIWPFFLIKCVVNFFIIPHFISPTDLLYHWMDMPYGTCYLITSPTVDTTKKGGLFSATFYPTHLFTLIRLLIKHFNLFLNKQWLFAIEMKEPKSGWIASLKRSDFFGRISCFIVQEYFLQWYFFKCLIILSRTVAIVGVTLT